MLADDASLLGADEAERAGLVVYFVYLFNDFFNMFGVLGFLDVSKLFFCVLGFLEFLPFLL